ncbi:MAG TPA: hypothetical protein VI893_01300 [Thermoplasmata archaeon]|nr:hypothetical protein [Thermoplasmata archaeon]
MTARVGLAGLREAWKALESKIPVKGRKFYGAFQHPDGPYRVCVAILPADDPGRLGLERWLIPGGKYASRKLLDWEEKTDRIGGILGELGQENDRDASCPNIEYYRSERELILLLPVK